MLGKLLGLVLSVCLVACSSTGSNIRQFHAGDRVEGVTLSIGVAGLSTSFQGSSRILTLHHSAAEVLAIAESVAALYGFRVMPAEQADFLIELHQVIPDGGDCVSTADAAELGISYSISLLTFGAFPATAVHCMVVEATLSANDPEEPFVMGDFVSNAGEIEVYAGINDLDNYQGTVKPNDEARSLEVSIAAMLSEMIREGAFE